jgi:HlyD family secretion protein
MLIKQNKKVKVLLGIAAVIVLAFLAKTYIFNPDFLYAGTLEATKVDLSSQLNSSISSVNVQEGAHVTVDQELVVLSCEDYKATAQLAKNIYDRNELLFKKGVVSKDMLDQISNKLQEANIHVSWCIIDSPIQGTVLSRYHEPGEIVSPGSKLITLANIADIWAYIYVPQTEVAKLKVGMEVSGILSELDNRKFKGKIIKINSEAEFTPKNVQTRSERTRLIYGVKVSFLGSNEDEILKPGMTIEIQLPKD